MRIYIIRHADPDYPNKTITPDGHKEAQALATRLKNEGLTRIYTSPLGRAKDTAQYTVDATGIQPVELPWTTEIPAPVMDLGPYGQYVPWNIAGEVIRAHPEAYLQHDGMDALPYIAGSPLVPLAREVRAASDTFLAGLGYEREEGLYRAVEPNFERIAIFCHGGFGVVWLSHLLEIPLPLMFSGFWLAPSSVSILLMEQRSDEYAVPRAITIGDTSHLYAAGLPILPRGILAQNWLAPHE